MIVANFPFIPMTMLEKKGNSLESFQVLVWSDIESVWVWKVVYKEEDPYAYSLKVLD